MTIPTSEKKLLVFGLETGMLAAVIVQTFTKDFQRTGSNVTCENYFTNLSLAETLAKQKTDDGGNSKKKQNSYLSDFNRFPLLSRPETALITYQGKRTQNVILLSTMHNRTKLSQDNNTPEIVLHYNKTTGRVVAMDQMVHAFT